VFVVAVAATALLGDLGAYDSYRDSDSTLGYCAQCHEPAQGLAFIKKGLLHTAHKNNATGNCDLCHTSSGDIPMIASSGEPGIGIGCNGCHDGVGLRRHHLEAAAPADSDGMTCDDCHPNDPVPFSERIMPLYYALGIVSQTNPCNPDGSEDFWGPAYAPDGKGLDNDGDLAYDADDLPDCGTPTCVDTDGDGYGDPGMNPTCPRGPEGDCDDAHASAHPGASEVYDQLDNDCDGVIDEVERIDIADPLNPDRVSWTEQLPEGTLYDVIRSDDPAFSSAAPFSSCLDVATPLLFTDDTVQVPLGSAFYYCVRNTMVNDYGMMSDGTPRMHALCP
jgi:hypothetical protein